MRQPTLLLCLLLCHATAPMAAEVFRCAGDAGEVSFQSWPCDQSSRAPLAFTPAEPQGDGLRPSERAWLRQRDAAASGAAGRKPRSERPRAKDAARQDYQCRRRREQLEAVNSELRRGYKPARGERLRRRRRAYEDYLTTFCS